MDELKISKAGLQELLNNFADVIGVDDFIELVIIHAKIETAREQFKKGDFITDEELDAEIESWK